jgi:uncharacterized spore protein YtfJ
MVIEELVQAVLTEVRKLTRTETVVGDPITVGETTILPVSRISVGFAVGGGQKTDKDGKGEATGGGATVEPVAFIVVRKDKVELVTVKKDDTGLGKIIDLVPQFVDKVKSMKDKKEPSAQSKKEKSKR